MSAPTELPVPDTVDVRSGPEVSDQLLSVLPLLGEWHGEGQAAGTGGDHRFGQWVRFSHDGRGFLAYDSRTWRLTDDGHRGAREDLDVGPREELPHQSGLAHAELARHHDRRGAAAGGKRQRGVQRLQLDVATHQPSLRAFGHGPSCARSARASPG